MDAADDAADRHYRTSASGRGVLLRALGYRGVFSHAEVGVPDRTAAFRRCGPAVAVPGDLLDCVLANVVRVPDGSRVSRPGLRGDLRTIGMEGGLDGRSPQEASAQSATARRDGAPDRQPGRIRRR